MGLVALGELQEFLGGDTSQDSELLGLILDQVETQFLCATNRRERPFGEAQAGRVEVKDGTGHPLLFLDYPIAALTTVITLGYASPWDESLTPTDPAVIQFAVGSRRVARVDGGRFGCLDRPGYVRVTYDTEADQPEDVKLIFMRLASAVYRQETGTEKGTSDRILPDGENLPIPADLSADWNAAVDAHWEPRI